MGRVNPESERKKEVKFPPWVGFEPTTSWSTVQRVTTELSPLPKLEAWLAALWSYTCRKRLWSTWDIRWCNPLVRCLRYVLVHVVRRSPPYVVLMNYSIAGSYITFSTAWSADFARFPNTEAKLSICTVFGHVGRTSFQLTAAPLLDP